MTDHSNEELLDIRLKNVNINIGDVYRHYKNDNNSYIIIAIALDESNEEINIVYQALYGKKLIWIRKLKDWLQPVLINTPDGVYSTTRFTKI